MLRYFAILPLLLCLSATPMLAPHAPLGERVEAEDSCGESLTLSELMLIRRGHGVSARPHQRDVDHSYPTSRQTLRRPGSPPASVAAFAAGHRLANGLIAPLLT